MEIDPLLGPCQRFAGVTITELNLVKTAPCWVGELNKPPLVFLGSLSHVMLHVTLADEKRLGLGTEHMEMRDIKDGTSVNLGECWGFD